MKDRIIKKLEDQIKTLTKTTEKGKARCCSIIFSHNFECLVCAAVEVVLPKQKVGFDEWLEIQNLGEKCQENINRNLMKTLSSIFFQLNNGHT